jgi:hypothetical protein
MKKIMTSLALLAALMGMTIGAGFAATSTDCCDGGTCCGGACCHHQHK